MMKDPHEKGVAIHSAPSFALDIARCNCWRVFEGSDKWRVTGRVACTMALPQTLPPETATGTGAVGWTKNGWLHVGALTQRRPRTSWRETLAAS
jgi:hypothetical protein